MAANLGGGAHFTIVLICETNNQKYMEEKQ